MSAQLGCLVGVETLASGLGYRKWRENFRTTPLKYERPATGFAKHELTCPFCGAGLTVTVCNAARLTYSRRLFAAFAFLTLITLLVSGIALYALKQGGRSGAGMESAAVWALVVSIPAAVVLVVVAPNMLEPDRRLGIWVSGDRSKHRIFQPADAPEGWL